MLIQVISSFLGQQIAQSSLENDNVNPSLMRQCDNSFQHQFGDAVRLIKPYSIQVADEMNQVDSRLKNHSALTKKLIGLVLSEDKDLTMGLVSVDDLMLAEVRKTAAQKTSSQSLDRDFEDRESVVALVLALRYQSEKIDPSSYLSRFHLSFFRTVDGRECAYWPWPWLKKDGKWILDRFEYGYRIGPSSRNYKLNSLLEHFREASIPLRARIGTVSRSEFPSVASTLGVPLPSEYAQVSVEAIRRAEGIRLKPPQFGPAFSVPTEVRSVEAATAAAPSFMGG